MKRTLEEGEIDQDEYDGSTSPSEPKKIKREERSFALMMVYSKEEEEYGHGTIFLQSKDRSVLELVEKMITETSTLEDEHIPYPMLSSTIVKTFVKMCDTNTNDNDTDTDADANANANVDIDIIDANDAIECNMSTIVDNVENDLVDAYDFVQNECLANERVNSFYDDFKKTYKDNASKTSLLSLTKLDENYRKATLQTKKIFEKNNVIGTLFVHGWY